MKYFNYTDLGIVSAKIPVNSPLWLEVNSAGSHYVVDTGDLTHLWYSANKMDTEIKIDIDPGDVWGGDDDHRPANIISAWHDRANKIIYFVDHSGGNTIYSWKLDYSASESAPLITEMGTIGGLTVVGDADIFLIGSDIFIWYVDTLELTVVKWVDPNWVNQDTAGSTSHPLSYVVVVGTIAYILLDAAPVILFSYTNGTTTMASIETFIGKSLPSSSNLLGITYDGSNILNFILNLDADGKNYLYSYNISGDSQTGLGIYNISLMLDRNTASGVLEKAFHLTEDKIYQIQEHTTQLYLIAVPDSDAVFVGITDNFLMNDDGDMFEYEDNIESLHTVVVDHQIEENSIATVTLFKDAITIEKNLVMRFIANYSSVANPPLLYRGTYNFKDDADGDEPADFSITNTGANCSTTVIASIDDHRKVMKLDDQSAVARTFAELDFGDPLADDVHEFYIAKDNIGANTSITFDFKEGATQIIYFEFLENDLRYFSGGWHEIKANFMVANTFVHIKIVPDDSNNTFDFYIDGVLEGNNLAYRNNSIVGLEKVSFTTSTGQSGYSVYIDAWGTPTRDANYKIGDNLTIQGWEEIIFEGIVTNFNEAIIQTVNLVSLGRREMKRIKPSGDYTVDSDGLISALIAAYNNYVTVGTLTDGTDLGTITLGGDVSEETIIDGTANFEGWIWYITPTGKIYFNNGTTDSTINYAESDGVFNVKPPTFIHEEFNRIQVKGAYVDGVQMVSEWQEDLDSQQRVGINEKSFNVNFLNTVALCNTAATNLLAILAKDPKKITFTIKDTTTGLIQPGETITFEYALAGLTISSDHFLITSAIITKEDEITYTIIDELT